MSSQAMFSCCQPLEPNLLGCRPNVAQSRGHNAKSTGVAQAACKKPLSHQIWRNRAIGALRPANSFEVSFSGKCHFTDSDMSCCIAAWRTLSRHLLALHSEIPVTAARGNSVRQEKQCPCRFPRSLGQIRKAVAAAAIAVLLAAGQPGPCLAEQGAPAVEALTKGRPEQLGDYLPIPTEFPPLPDLALPPYEKIILPNGLRVLFLEDHELGLVGGQLLVKGGGKADPADKRGLAAVTGAVQRTGGTAENPGDALNARLESMAARIEAGAGVSEMRVAFRCLREDLADVFTLFTDVVRQPLMPQDKLDLVKSQLQGGLARRNDDPGSIAARELPKLLYGASSPYARIPESTGVKAITREDIIAFHAANFRPDQAVLGIWGDFDAAAAKALVQQRLADWAPAPLPAGPQGATAALVASSRMPRALEEGRSKQPPGIYLIDRPGLTQGYVRMGELGTTLADPDVFALDVLNSLLNGFGGRLFDEVRSREGLAYSVFGGWSPAVEHRGSFVAGGETRVTTVPKFITAVRRVLGSLTVEAPSAEELAQAKDASLNSFVFNFADSGSQLSRIMTYELFGVEQDFIFKYKREVEATSAEDVLRVARQHLHPEQQPIVIVTDVDAIKKELATFNQPLIDVEID